MSEGSRNDFFHRGRKIFKISPQGCIVRKTVFLFFLDSERSEEAISFRTPAKKTFKN